MNSLPEADRYLLEQIRGGDAAGWSQLVSRYQGRLCAYARRKLHGEQDAEDLVQDTFVSFLKALDSFRGQSSLETFLFAILRRKVVNQYRSARSSICLLQDLLAPESSTDAGPAAADATASSYARRREDQDRQRAALAAAVTSVVDGYRTSENFRDLKIVELLFYCQLRNRDIAEVIGVPENHVAVLKHRCLRQIRDAVTRELAGGEVGELGDALLTQIWREARLSCPKRSTIGAYVLGTLEPGWHDYVAFHLERLGCEFCRANLDDLRTQTASQDASAVCQRIMQSTVGFLRPI